MESIQNQFLDELNQLEKLIEFFDIEQEILKTESPSDSKVIELKEKHSTFYSQKRIFNYNTLIISLYGFFEKFIENILIQYVDKVNSIFQLYNKLPEIILKNHFKLSINLLDKIQNPRYSGPLNKELIIQRLHECININENFQLNKEAFSQHSANFRLQVLDDIFGRVGIESLSSILRKNEKFLTYIKAKYELSEINDLTSDEIFSILNDLAERRNEVAHGVPSEILSNEIIHEYIEYFKILSEAILDVTYYKLRFLNISENCQYLSDITDCYRNGIIACFYTNKTKLSKGDFLYGFNNESIVLSKVMNIQLDDIDIETIDDSENYEIGVLLEKPFKKNYKVYKINATQHMV